MWVDERWTMVTSAPASHSAAQMSCAELLEPITTTRLPRSRPARGAGTSGAARPGRRPCPGARAGSGWLDMPVAKTSCLGRSVTRAPSRSTCTIHSCASSSQLALLAVGRAPVVELHHPRVHLEPVADLVLRREDRPVLGELDVGQVVVPDRVVQAERLVALRHESPGRGLRSTMIVGTPSWRSRAPSPMPPCPPPMMTTYGLRGVARAPRPRAGAARARSRDRGSAPCSTPRGRRGPARLLVALELVERGEQRPGLAVLEAQVPAAAADRGLERDPGLGDAVGLRRRLGRVQAARADVREPVLEQVGDALRPLDGLDVPREGDEVAPVAVVGEELRGGRRVAGGERRLEARQPVVDLAARWTPGRRRSRPCLSVTAATSACKPVRDDRGLLRIALRRRARALGPRGAGRAVRRMGGGHRAARGGAAGARRWVRLRRRRRAPGAARVRHGRVRRRADRDRRRAAAQPRLGRGLRRRRRPRSARRVDRGVRLRVGEPDAAVAAGGRAPGRDPQHRGLHCAGRDAARRRRARRGKRRRPGRRPTVAAHPRGGRRVRRRRGRGRVGRGPRGGGEPRWRAEFTRPR